MSLVSSFSVGGFRCHCLDAGSIRLDGGAMFGVVAKPLWEKHFEADAQNRIGLALRCLLVEHDAGPVLIDTGIGNKAKEKFLRILLKSWSMMQRVTFIQSQGVKSKIATVS